jgi:hypothetical protein
VSSSGSSGSEGEGGGGSEGLAAAEEDDFESDSQKSADGIVVDLRSPRRAAAHNTQGKA